MWGRPTLTAGPTNRARVAMIELVNRAVIQFAVSALVAIVLLGAAAVELMRRVGTDEAISDAKQVTALAGRGIVAPNLTPALERGVHRLLGCPRADRRALPTRQGGSRRVRRRRRGGGERPRRAREQVRAPVREAARGVPADHGQAGKHVP